MRNRVCIVIICAGAVGFLSGCNRPASPGGNTPATNNAVAATNAPSGTNVLNTEKARVSYAIGMSTAHNLTRQGVEVDGDLVARGIQDGLTGKTLLTADEAQQTLMTFQREFMAQQQKKREELAVKDKTEADAFLASNKDNPGVVTLPDGLQYKVITNGNGPIPTNSDIVTVNYRGTLLNGSEFDSSFKRGQPAKFPVTGVIRGWTEALEHMNVGSKWELFVPPDLGYGLRSPPSIPPNSLLIFDVDLLSKEGQAPPKPAEPLTSDIIKVPSAEDLKRGSNIEVIKPEDIKKMQQQ